MKKKAKISRQEKNRQMVLLLGAIVLLMSALAYASVPLYTIFCRATGLGGTTQRVAARTDLTLPDAAKDRSVTVSFDGNVDPSLPWSFAPETRSVTVKLGETTTIKYRARNNSARTLTGTAAFNVQPSKAGLYFDKIQCFCFTKQTLKPGETKELPVEFYVDPAMAADDGAKDVTNITLSYTFFLAKTRANSVKAAFPLTSAPLSPRALGRVGQSIERN